MVDDNPVKVLTPFASLPHAALDAKIRTTFDDTKPTPESWSEHVCVNVHSSVPVYGPEI
jgi:hypothetical protein